uniref:Uncharacterized protein n=1 Tax=Arundo donax TaxID=35708 RepID=A0A0A8YDA3_ARUDO
MTGALPPIISTNVLKAHLKLHVVSLVNRTPAKITLWK